MDLVTWQSLHSSCIEPHQGELNAHDSELQDKTTAQSDYPSTAHRYPMETLLLRITGLIDESSVRILANAIQDLPNIGHLEISRETGQASVDHGRFVSPDDILQAIVDAGFEAESI